MERLCVENILSASDKGACILNHATATELLMTGDNVSGINLRDSLTGEDHTANGRIVVNAAGHWADIVWNEFYIRSKDKIRRTKGIHLFTRKLSEHALVLFAKSDGRLFFVVPWGDYSLVGTIGQPDAAYSADEQYELFGGFWPTGPACTVEFEDFAGFAEFWLQTGVGLSGDLYEDNVVNVLDLKVFVDYWLCYCPLAWPLK